MHESTRGRGPGQWWPLLTSSGMRATFYCPNCGQAMSLSYHTIYPDGVVMPSVVAPAHGAGCEFHDHIHLNGWRDVSRT